METNGTVRLPKCEIGSNYLKVMEDATDSDLQTIFRYINTAHASTLFWLGDFLNTIELRKGETYLRLFDLTGYTPGALTNAKSVCKAFPPQKRFNLSYSHHAEARSEAKKDAEKASQFLAIAEKEKLSQKALRSLIRKSQAKKPKDEGVTFKSDAPFVELLDALGTVRRYLISITSKTPTEKKAIIRSWIEDIASLANKKLSP